MFFVDKYSPKNIRDMFFHFDILKKLALISRNNDIPHLIIHGPPESGKKTLIKFFLEMVFDKTINKTRLETYTVSGAGNNNETEIELNQSNQHIVIYPNGNNFDKHIVQNVIKEYARIEPLKIFKTNRPFKVVLIHNADNLSYHAQTSLRRTMETYSKTCRFIMCCTTLSKIIQPVRSRCYCVRVPYPTKEELFNFVTHISLMENIPLTLDDKEYILRHSNNRIKKALWILGDMKHEVEKKTSSYDDIINDIVKLILEPNLKNILAIRDLLYNIMITTIPGHHIVTSIMNVLLRKVKDESKQIRIIECASTSEHKLLLGRRDINHLGWFIINIMDIIHSGDKKFDNAKTKLRASSTKKKIKAK